VAAIGAGIRWDRVGRTAMLLVALALIYLYASAGVHMLSTWRQSRHDDATVAALAREHAALVREHSQLTGTAALEANARQLGMMRPNEQPYVITGLPDN
jgi:cell division protein FtsB